MQGAFLSKNNIASFPDRMPRPVIFGCASTVLTPMEHTIFREADPFGFILFKRNCDNPDQVRYLIRELRQATRREDVPIFIDQEGGRVTRLQPPHWPKLAAARYFGEMYERDPDWGREAMHVQARIVAYELSSLGFTVNCAPVVDLLLPKTSPAIGERAFSADPSVVAAMARTQAETFLDNGILPVIKHFPGHGRLPDDPHHVLPTITATRAELETQDFVPFSILHDMPIGMNSHAIFTALDPDHPASLSARITHEIIRDALDFDGLLISDDITMKALKGTAAELTVSALEAGNDVVMHCNGNASEMEAIARALKPMEMESWRRWAHACAVVKASGLYSPYDDVARLDVLLGGLAFEL